MRLEDIWPEIEGPQLAARVGVVSTPRSLERALAAEPNVRQLVGALAKPTNRRLLYDRFLVLLHTPTDERFAHPQDLALATYLRLLDIVNPDLGEMGAATALTRPNLWWTRAFAASILAQAARRTRVVISQHLAGPIPATRVNPESSSLTDMASSLVWEPTLANEPIAATAASTAESALVTTRERVHVSTRGEPT
jgi:hypothetical protein